MKYSDYIAKITDAEKELNDYILQLVSKIEGIVDLRSLNLTNEEQLEYHSEEIELLSISSKDILARSRECYPNDGKWEFETLPLTYVLLADSDVQESLIEYLESKKIK